MASYLDVLASVSRLLQRQKDEGCNVDLPQKPLHEIFQNLGHFNSAFWQEPEKLLKSSFCLEEGSYMQFFSSLPQSMRLDVAQA